MPQQTITVVLIYCFKFMYNLMQRAINIFLSENDIELPTYKYLRLQLMSQLTSKLRLVHSN